MQSNKNIDYKNAVNEQVYPCSDALRFDRQGWLGTYSLNYAIPQYIEFALPISNIFQNQCPTSDQLIHTRHHGLVILSSQSLQLLSGQHQH